MRSGKKPVDILKDVKTLIKVRYPGFGPNKAREITRLLYEISKRDNIPPNTIIEPGLTVSFQSLKSYLLKKRFPYSSMDKRFKNTYLPEVKLSTEDVCALDNKTYYPETIYIEKKAVNTDLTKRFLEYYPNARVEHIYGIKSFIAGSAMFRIKDFNDRCDKAFITYQKHDLFKRCPCTKGAVGCGYNIFNLSFGCIYECTYCYLQSYTDSPGIIYPANVDNFFDELDKRLRPGMRLGTGEFSDSLMIDHVTGYSKSIINFFRDHTDCTFEFKTKSSNISNLLESKHNGNIVVSWSFNPPCVISENEHYCATLEQRVKAAKLCSGAGYRIGIHFDPIILHNGWRYNYSKVIDRILSQIAPGDIAWISLGTLRFKPETKKVIESRFPENHMLDEELICGYDGKLRYPFAMRLKIYAHMIDLLERHSASLPIYLCMEDQRMWRELRLKNPFFQ